MKCFHIVIGLSPVWGDTVKVMPRLPKGRRVSVKDFPLINTKATVDMETAYPVDNTQSMTLTLHGEIPAQALRVRFGLFASESDTVEPDTPEPDTDAPTEPAESDTTSRMARFC
ncbi:MAG: hypothetical protein IJ363_09880 [Clostridia bacterium]|nr:hypothetical protein [Clostridia bacterium]